MATKDVVTDFLKTVGLKYYKNSEQFWSNLLSKHDSAIISKLEEVIKDRGQGNYTFDNNYFYTLKNNNLKLSLDVSSYSTDLYFTYLKWFLKQNYKPKTLLDIGCDNGIITCFYAQLFPRCQVIGIDVNTEGIARAKELAKKLHISNVAFIESSCETLIDKFAVAYFDLITSLRSFHEIFKIPQKKYWNIHQLNFEHLHNPTLNDVQKLLKDSGNFISAERLATFSEYVWWIESLYEAGLSNLWGKKAEIGFNELGEKQVLPIFTAVSGIDQKISREQILDFYIGNVACHKDEKEFEDMLAEKIFSNCTDKKLIEGMQINYLDGQGDLRAEIWCNDKEILFYQYSNVGFRRLNIMPKDQLQKIIKELQLIKDRQRNMGNTAYSYNIRQLY